MHLHIYLFLSRLGWINGNARKWYRWSEREVNILPEIIFFYSQSAYDMPGMSHEDSLKVLTFGNYKGPSRESQGTNTKFYHLMKKLYFRSNDPCITYLYMFFMGKVNIKMIQMGTFMERLRDLLMWPHGVQMIGNSRDVCRTLVKLVF